MGDVMFTAPLHCMAAIAAGAAAAAAATTTRGAAAAAQLLPLPSPPETLKWRSLAHQSNRFGVVFLTHQSGADVFY